MDNFSINKVNNFNLIRLLAAFQVAFEHAISHFNIHLNPIFDVITFFPGVPVFFTVSGFLITNSFKRNPDLRQYTINREIF